MSRFHLVGDMLGDSAHSPSGTKARPGKPGNASGGNPSKTTAGFRTGFSAMIRKKPEVMVKISGFGKHRIGIQGNLDYISRNGELALETADGQLLEGKEEIKALAVAWANDSSRKRLKQRDTMNLIVSMPAGTNRESVLNAAREFAAKTFKANHDYVFVDHRDEKHSHVHVTVRMRGHDGTRLNPRKADLQQWRDNFAESLKGQGIEAAASPRRARGIVLKPVKQAIQQMRERADGLRQRGQQAGQTLVDKNAIDEAFQDIRNPGIEPRPWEQHIRARQQQIRSNYLQAAKILSGSNDLDERKLAEQLRAFVREMPAINTRRHLLRQSIVAGYQKSIVKERDAPERSR